MKILLIISVIVFLAVGIISLLPSFSGPLKDEVFATAILAKN